MNAEQYVLGFLFDELRQRVVLIRKLKPLWQAGKLNGVGGKIEAGEGASAAMAREFLEEAGVAIRPDDWEYFCVLSGPTKFQVRCFYATANLAAVRTMENEKVEIVDIQTVSLVQPDMIENVPFLIALALDCSRKRQPLHLTTLLYLH